MLIDKKGFFDLTYCTNIHSGESWPEVMQDLNNFVLPLKVKLSPRQPFGIGLRLSRTAADQLSKPEPLVNFKKWLSSHQLYVMTINGFPYGAFHNARVKEDAYHPDWTKVERRDYTEELINILSYIMEPGTEAGISTSPLSYKPWLTPDTLEMTFKQCSLQLAYLIKIMAEIFNKEKKLIHIDIEPEPDCLIETMDELIKFYNTWLLPTATEYLTQQLHIPKARAEKMVRRHIQACYDICHASVEFEQPSHVFAALKSARINIGKIQVSAAIRCMAKTKQQLLETLKPFNDNTYLHQVIEQDNQGHLCHFTDLPSALSLIETEEMHELRIHFHVPVFLSRYENLNSTQNDIVSVLRLLQKNKATKHLEIETYTWDVLPSSLKLDLVPSIEREYQWVMQHFER
jgi:hypothetical protein